jgi:hypothetical protein
LVTVDNDVFKKQCDKNSQPSKATVMPTKLYHSSDTTDKIEFLDFIMQKDARVRRDFDYFIENQYETSKLVKRVKLTIPDIDAEIAEVKAQAVEDLEALAITDQDLFHYSHAMQNITGKGRRLAFVAEDKLDALMSEYYFSFQSHMREHRFDNAVTIAIGLFDACLTARAGIAYALPNGEESVLRALMNSMERLHEVFTVIWLPFDQFYTIAFSVLSHSRAHYPGDPRFLNAFQPILEVMLVGRIEAELLRRAMKESGVKDEVAPELAMKISQWIDSPPYRKNKMRRLATHSDTVASELIIHHSRRGDKKEFFSLAKKLWKEQSLRGVIAECFYSTFKSEDNPALFREVIHYLAARYRTEEYYALLMQHYGEEERAVFRASFADDPEFSEVMSRLERYGER